MPRRIYLILLSLFLAPLGSASILISEVELNPEGTDSGREWIELSSDSEFDMEGYKIVNNDGDEFLLKGEINRLYVIEFEKQWLDNSNEKVFLYKGESIVDETILFNDSKNDDSTWALCNNQWIFTDSSKGLKNCLVSAQDVQAVKIENESNGETLNINKTEVESQVEIRSNDVIIINNVSVKNDDFIAGQAVQSVSEENTDVIYKSKNEIIKERAIYLLAFILLSTIFYNLLRNKA